MPTSGQTNRVAFIDIARGIGILLVVLGHNYNLQSLSPFLHNFIFSFHVPLFFFLSGFVFKLPETILELILNKGRTIMRPFAITIILAYLGQSIFLKIGIVEAFKRAALALIYATGSRLEWSQLWFLPVLFLIFIAAYTIIKGAAGRAWVLWILLFILLGVGQVFIQSFWPFVINLRDHAFEFYGIPYSVDILLPCLAFFLAGYCMRNIEKMDGSKSLLLTGSALILLVALNLFFDARMDLFKRIFDSFLINTMEAFLGIVFVLGLSMLIEETWISNALMYFGRNSLFILLFHLIVQESWRFEISSITSNGVLALCASFLVGLLGPVFIFEFFVRNNPKAQKLYFGK